MTLTDENLERLRRNLLTQLQAAGAAGATLEELHTGARYAVQNINPLQVMDEGLQFLINSGMASKQAGALVATRTRYFITDGGQTALSVS